MAIMFAILSQFFKKLSKQLGALGRLSIFDFKAMIGARVLVQPIPEAQRSALRILGTVNHSRHTRLLSGS
jgi:hypothetical protein